MLILKKLGKKISDAADCSVPYTLVIGTYELSSGVFTIKDLSLGTSESGTLEDLLTHLIAHTK